MHTTQQQPVAAAGWPFWSAWGLAFLGFPLGGLAGQTVAGPVHSFGAAVLAGGVTGAVLGAVQWFVLRRRRPLNAWWIAATAGGMAAGLAFSTILLGSETTQPGLVLRGLITGIGVGTAQWAVLHSWGSCSTIWAAVVALAWPIGWTITHAVGVDLSPQWAIFGSTGAWAFQLFTGLALAWITQTQATH